MSQLYTTLVMVKRSLNDGRLPPMTPIPEEIRHIINPENVPGLGALNEDDEKGVQCPVCGGWFHTLTLHLNRTHQDEGGAKGIKRALGLPPGVALISNDHRKKMRKVALASGCAANLRPTRKGRRTKRRPSGRGKLTTSERNFKNTCHAQIGHRLCDLHNRLGRSPSMSEAKALDPGLGPACIVIYGTWDAAKAMHGIGAVTRRGQSTPQHSRGSVMASISAWVEANGRLPGSGDVRLTLPMLPEYATILKYLKADSWKGAMRKAAVSLGIYHYRYRPGPTLRLSQATRVPKRSLAKIQKLLDAGVLEEVGG